LISVGGTLRPPSGRKNEEWKIENVK